VRRRRLAAGSLPRLVALAAASAALALPAAANGGCEEDGAVVVSGIGTPAEELARLAELAPGELAHSSGMLRRGSVTRRTICAGAPGTPWDLRYAISRDEAAAPPRLAAVPVRVLGAFHNLSPGGTNDGLLWQGRGVSSMLSAGVSARWGPFSAQLAPEVAWAQNQDFRLYPTGQPGDLAYANPFYGPTLDLPQRMGPDPFTRVTLGQSYLQAEAFGLAFGVSTENRWWGPGVRNALLVSNNAEGIPHVYLETARPLDIRIGNLEAVFLVGQVTRTRWYAGGSDSPAYTGFAFTYEPVFAPGLYLGAGRTYIEPWSVLRGDGFLSALQPPGNLGTNLPTNNQLLSVWARWVMPASGFEAWLEWARDDAATFAGFVRTYDRTSAYTAGFQKLAVMGGRWVRVQAEASRTRDFIPGGPNVFYAHSNNTGYAQAGQLIGAAMGPGADSQYFGVDVFTRGGRIGGYVERIRRNDEFLFTVIVPAQPDRVAQRDVELVGMLRQVVFAGALDVSWEAGGGYRWNRNFLGSEPVFRAQLVLSLPVGGGAR
jgi:hypothetical protein